jgi:radical SAM protein
VDCHLRDEMNFDQAPLIVIWEATQACDLACVHCRASAAPERHRSELTTDEGYRLLEQIREFGTPLMVFTGGDPLKRPDLSLLLRRSVALGLRTNVSPSATPLLTRQAIQEFKDCGVQRMAISLDGPNGSAHDEFRGVAGTYDRAIEALEDARLIGLETQLQTTVTRRNMHSLDQIAQIAAAVNVRMWSVFFLVVTGRALAGDDLMAEEYEQVFEKLYEISQWAPFDVKTTEAMHYRRYLARRNKEESSAPSPAQKTVWRTAGVSDARGFVFISHTGEIYPSGFLPVSAGNVRCDSLVDVYRTSMLFRILRDPECREGKCGACEYTRLCGGSRARAYAATGDYLAEDPRCNYQPSGLMAARELAVQRRLM